ncbi:MAG: AAA family ATPase [Acidimicrobiaceae bacterium]|nr:AAA family ATPase [Acidimicrobiaceae bacterium]
MTISSVQVLADAIIRRAGVHEDVVWTTVVTRLATLVLDEHVALDLRLDPEVRELRELEGLSYEDLLDHLRVSEHLVQFLSAAEEPTPAGPPLCLVAEQYIAFRRLAHAEWRLSEAVTLALSQPLEWPAGFSEMPSGIDDVGDAARRIMTHRLSLVVGGPGTGKTTLVARVLSALEAGATEGARLRVVLSAPTGKAVVRLIGDVSARAESEGWRAVRVEKSRSGSLHHLLGLTPESSVARRRVEADVVVVDEASMGSLGLVSELVRSLGENTRLVLVGDPHQLASVDEGSVLADLLEASDVTGPLATVLTRVHRTDSAAVLAASRAVLEGDEAELRHVAEQYPEFELLDQVTPHLLARVHDHVRRVGQLAMEGSGDEAWWAARELAVLCARREGTGSTRWWREALAARYRTEFPRVSASPFSLGESVMVTRNQSHLGVVNGDVGVVLPRRSGPVVYFGDGREWPLPGVGYLESAWALTIHKSQGSEYEEVVVSLGSVTESELLSRELVYTGLTRAQRRVTVVGEPLVLRAALSRRVSRTSSLVWRLAQLR